MKPAARTHELTKRIYRRHIRFYRFLNDTWIFYNLIDPILSEKETALANSTSNTKRRYSTPKKSGTVHSRRRDADIAKLFKIQNEREIFKTNIISIVSRFEAHILDCLTGAIKLYPKKLSLISDKTGIPVDLFLKHSQYDDVLSEYISQKVEGLMFNKPDAYLEKAEKVLSIKIDDDIASDYIEIKATRDAIVHAGDLINQIYIDKSGVKARGELGNKIVIDKLYFRHVVVTAKRLSGSIMNEIEKKYG